MRRIVAVVCTLFLSVTCVAQDVEMRVRNLRAFAKLYGYVRYFHPSDEAAAIDWERFAVHGANTVAACRTGDELRAALNTLFLPIAPSLQLYGDGETPKKVSAPDGEELPTVAWQHAGVGLADSGIYRSVRLNRKSAAASGATFGGILQSLDAAPLRGKEVRFSGLGKAAVEGTGNQLQFWMRVDLPNRKLGFFENMDSRPIRSNEWKAYEIAGTVAGDAQRIFFGAFLAGNGRAWVDAFRLDARDPGGEWKPVAIANPAFESDAEGNSPAGWNGGAPGYRLSVSTSGAGEGQRSAMLERQLVLAETPALFAASPKLGETTDALLAPGLHARIPLALPSRDDHTLPIANAADLASLQKALANVDMNASDVRMRVADVAVAWNVFQHFYPYFDVVKTDWDGVLAEALRRAIPDATPAQFRETLRWMVAALHDGHGGVYSMKLDGNRAALPFLVEWVEGKPVVVATGDESPFQTGDVIVSIDGETAEAFARNHAAHRSGSEQWKRTMAGREFGRGEKDTVAKVVVERQGTHVALDAPRTSVGMVPARLPANFSEVRPGVMYVDLSSAEMTEIDANAEKLAAARGIIFDLRGYPKGNHDVLTHLTTEPIQSARWQIPQIVYPDRQRLAGYDESGRWTLAPKAPRFGGKIVFLTGGGAISYAESVMGIVEHHNLGTIVGGRTAGANGNVNTIQLPGGYRVNFTGMRVIKHDGSQHHLVGILPDVPVERTIAGVRAGRDEVLEKGIEVIESAAAR